MANLRWINSLLQPESNNDAGGEEIKTSENSSKNDKFDGFKLRILKI